MAWLATLVNRLRSLTRRREIESSLDDELAAHLALKEQRLRAEGIPAAEAARQARLDLGNPAVWRESAREAWTFGWLEGLWRDVRFGARVLIKDRVYTLVALITLALGIGANTAVFSVLNGLLWRSLPVEEPERLIRIRFANPPPTDRAWVKGRAMPVRERTQIPYPLYESLRDRQHVFDGMFGVCGHGDPAAVLEYRGNAHQIRLSGVTGSYFSVLGVQPRFGRVLSDEDDRPGGSAEGWTAVVSEGICGPIFGGCEAAIGARVSLAGVPLTIVGVAPSRFTGVHPGSKIDAWITLAAYEAAYPVLMHGQPWRTNPGAWVFQGMARLRPGVPFEQAREHIASLSQPLLEEIKPANVRGEDERHFLAMKLDLVPMRSGHSGLVDSFGSVLWILMAAVGAVLLIAATNLTNLSLARATARGREMAVRMAIGASRGRIRRQLLIESVLLAMAGTGLGIVISFWLSAALVRHAVNPANPIYLDVPMDWMVLGFIALALTMTVSIAGGAPAWSASRGSIQERASARSGSRAVMSLRGGLIVAQIALSFTLLGGASLLTSSLQATYREATGFSSSGVTLVTPGLLNAGIDPAALPLAYEELLNGVRGWPGVAAAAWTRNVPLEGNLQAFTIETPGVELPPNERLVFSHQVTSGYFSTMGIPLRAGADFPPPGSRREPASILSENLARKLFGTAEAAIGKRLKPGNFEWTEIIGVAADTKYHHIREPNPHTVYTSYWDQRSALGMTLVLRYAGPQEALAGALRERFQQHTGRLPLLRVRTLGDGLSSSVTTEKSLAWLLGGFALFALVICATGIAGLLSYSVQLRRREIGIRLALGAAPAAIRRRIQSQGLRYALAGLAAGAVASYWSRNVLDAYLFRTEATDPRIWLGVSAILLLSALVSSAIPAMRAARIDPMRALRIE